MLRYWFIIVLIWMLRTSSHIYLVNSLIQVIVLRLCPVLTVFYDQFETLNILLANIGVRTAKYEQLIQ